MGFLKRLASTAGTAVLEGAKTGVVSGLASGLLGNNPLTSSINLDYKSLFSNSYFSSAINTYSSLSSYRSNMNTISDQEWTNRNDGFKKLENTNIENGKGIVLPKDQYISYDSDVVDTPWITSGYKLNIPSWGYDSFVHERSIWQKGLQSPFGEPGYFYFKIFFDFDTQYGLFGGILNNLDELSATNSAGKYLKLLSLSNNYSFDLLTDRLIALHKFTNILSYINSNAPWFFNGVKGLDKAMVPVLKDFSKERKIEIECSTDAIDMRLTTLLDLYTFACYDTLNDREIIPDNLRKFNMMIMLFNTPIKHLHTPTLYSKNHSYKSLNNNDFSNFPSCKIFSFQNCEFVTDTLGSSTPGSINNETPFSLGKNTIGITYDECLTYNMNEFNAFMFGTDGIYYDNYINLGKSKIRSGNMKDGHQISNITKSTSINKNYDRYNSDFINYQGNINLSSYEQFAHNNLTTMTNYGFGNLYGSLATKPNSKYYNEKVKFRAGKTSGLAEAGVNVIAKLLGSNYRSSAKLGDDGYLPGYGQRAVGSPYWKAKIEKLKKGKSSGYNNAVYNMVNDIDRAKTFNLRDTLIRMTR